MSKSAGQPTFIPFNRPALTGREMEYMAQAVAQGQISGDGYFTRKCHAWLERVLGVPRALLTTSGTHALELAALLLDIQPGDEVIIPSFTFVSTANAFVLRGARPVFCDIRPDTLNMDEKVLKRLITKRTRAIVPVHYAGVGCAMDAILDLAAKRKIAVVEDNAHGLFGKYYGKHLGTFGVLAAQSFHETKNFSCGEGGALLINDPALAERAEILREKGTDRSRFFRGQVDKYSWVDLGSSFLPSDMLAAYLFAQFERRTAIQRKRSAIWRRYSAGLRSWAAANSVRLPVVPPECEHPAHMFYLLMPDQATRQGLINALRRHNIYAVFHYQPLHTSTMGRKFGGQPGDCPVTESVSDRLVRLPFYFDLTESDQKRVIQAVTGFTL
ncbi:MAG: dTDP-4-amino-4,6-dideoxygalactose transaminase [Kiritimatiellia bacterium]|jgi:dTDP-4-amino-4,6-dideoxygalactose transaminase